MIKHNQDGAVSGVAISLILTIVLLIAAASFGLWAFSSRQDYKNNVDAKIKAASEVVKQQESTLKDQQFAEESKKPLKSYNGPQAYGSLVLNYPKTWSGYVDDSGSGRAFVDGYFAPGTVPSITNQTFLFALRIQVVNQPYATVLQSFASQQTTGKLSVSAYALPLLPSVVGVKISGQLSDQKTVTMVVLPLRSQTVKISTEGTQYLNDFNNSILPNLTFIP